MYERVLGDILSSDPSKARSVVIIGLGYVGLPLALEACRAGHSVVGLDTSPDTVKRLNAGKSHVEDVSSAELVQCLGTGFSATSDPSCLLSADTVVICVPTPLSQSSTPDLTYVREAAQAIANHMGNPKLIVLESTTYPGTTEDVLRPILESTGRRAGTDFHLAFSPERIDPGNSSFTLVNTPKIVGGYTTSCTENAVNFYNTIVDEVVPVLSTREAELAKLLENTYRNINIALVNELAIVCHDMGIDIWNVIRAASTKPYGFEPFYPGPGVGGHCIPIDPSYLTHAVRTLGYQFRLVELAQDINARMPHYVVQRAQEILNWQSLPLKGTRILLLGLSYKRDTSDARETPAATISKTLHQRGAEILGCDPYVRNFSVESQPLRMVDLKSKEASSADLAILLQAHSAFDLHYIESHFSCTLDTRGILTGPNVYRL